MPPSSEGAFQRGPEMITAYTAAFLQSGSSSAGIRVIRASDIRQVVSTREIPCSFLEVLWDFNVPHTGL